MLATIIAALAAQLPSSLKYKVRPLKSLYIRVLRLGQSSVTVHTSAGAVRWVIDDLTSQEFLRGTYEPYMQAAFREYVQTGSVVFDVGAHSGFHSLFCALLTGPRGQVLAFEPNPISRQSLERQIAVNSAVHIRVMPYALSDHRGTALLTSENAVSKIRSYGTFPVVLQTIDALIDNGLPVPQVIKIDVEGSERDVLKGALQTLRNHRPIVLCDYDGDQTFSTVQDVLKPLNYTILEGPPVIAAP